MKKLFSIFLVCSLILSGCSFFNDDSASKNVNKTGSQGQNEINSNSSEVNVEFFGLGDPELLTYTEDEVYQSVLENIDSDKYFVENVQAIYLSQEYINEVEYNSQENIYFGYTLSDLDAQFEGSRYVFSVDDDGKTTVSEFEEYDDTYDQILKNVAIGTGVILLCVTVSVVSAGAGAPAVAMIFAGAAKTGTAFALSSAAIGGTVSTAITYSQTGDVKESLKEGMLEASSEFKWGAILGVVSGGTSTAFTLKGETLNGLTMNEAAKIQKESKYSIGTIKQLKSTEEFNIYKQANLHEQKINGSMALVRDIDLNYVSELADGTKLSNLGRMEKGLAPVDPATKKSYHLHHVGQKADGTLAILTSEEHLGNSSILHKIRKGSEINREVFDTVREEFWKAFAESVK